MKKVHPRTPLKNFPNHKNIKALADFSGGRFFMRKKFFGRGAGEPLFSKRVPPHPFPKIFLFQLLLPHVGAEEGEEDILAHKAADDTVVIGFPQFA